MSFTNIKSVMLMSYLASGINAFAATEDYDVKRDLMVEEVQQMVTMTESFTGTSALDEQVVEAMKAVPRHEFVTAEFRDNAYDNTALPIDFYQTISQPYIVALMTQLAKVSPDSVVLEVGTGSGYQAAVLAEIVNHVYSIEILEPLGREAEARLQRLGYNNITVKIGDGYHGWSEHAPFDAIIVTAAAPHIPEQLIEQLKPGGRLVIPVGEDHLSQSLKVVIKNVDGEIEEREVLPVAFVPLTGEH